MPEVRHRSPTRSKSAAVRLAALRPSRRQIRRWNRERRTHRMLIGGAIGVVVLVGLILGFGYLRENYLRGRETVGSVNGESISLNQVLERVKPRAAALDAQARQYQAQGMGQLAAQFGLQRSNLPDQMLDAIVEEKLVAAELERRGITVSADEVEASVQKFVADQEALSRPTPAPTASPSPAVDASPAADASPGPAPTPTPPATATPAPTLSAQSFQSAYQSFLARGGLTDEAFRELQRAEIARDKLKKSLTESSPRTEEMVRARHILVDNTDSLAQVQAKLAEGVPFDQVAKEFSTDTGTRDKGGDLGWFPRGQMNAPFEEAAFSQPIGDIGQPVQSPNGTHIIQVLERDPNHPLTDEQVTSKSAQAYQTWYNGVRNGEDIKREMTPDGRAWLLRQATRSQGR